MKESRMHTGSSEVISRFIKDLKLAIQARSVINLSY